MIILDPIRFILNPGSWPPPFALVHDSARCVMKRHAWLLRRSSSGQLATHISPGPHLVGGSTIYARLPLCPAGSTAAVGPARPASPSGLGDAVSPSPCTPSHPYVDSCHIPMCI